MSLESNAARLLALAASTLFAGVAIADAKLPATLAWTAYGVGSAGYNQSVGIGNALKHKYNVSLRVLPGKNDVSRNLPLRNAIGTSAAIGFPIAVGGTLGYVATGLHLDALPGPHLGFVYLPALLWIALASLLGRDGLLAAEGPVIDPARPFAPRPPPRTTSSTSATAPTGITCSAIRRASSATTSSATESPARAAAKIARASYGGASVVRPGCAAASCAASAETAPAHGSTSWPRPTSA